MFDFFQKCLLLLGILLISISAKADEKFKVGVIAPLSGPLAEYGLADQNGIELAKKDHPELFKNIEFIYEDSQWDAKAAVSAFSKLKDSLKVSLVYNWGNPTSEAIAPLAERYKLPLLALSLDSAVSKGRKYTVRTSNSAEAFSAVLAKHLIRQGHKRVGIVNADNTYVEGLINGLRVAIGNKLQIEVVDRYGIQDQDFRSSISKIRQKKFDALGVFLISGQVSAFYRQLNDQGIKLPTFGSDFFESTTEIRLAKGGMDGAVYPHLGVTDAFKKSYVSIFKNDYQLAYAGNSYDMAMVIGKLFGSGVQLDPDAVIEKLKSVSKMPGIGGEFSYSNLPDADQHFEFPVQLKQIKGEEIQTVAVAE